MSIPYGTLRDIADELKNIREILEKQSTETQNSNRNSNRNSNYISVVDSEDCISREWVLREFETGRENISKSEYFDELIWLVIHAPSVAPSRAEGEWIEDNLGILICSECKRPRRDSRINHTKFCNSCGAKMKGADDECL